MPKKWVCPVCGSPKSAFMLLACEAEKEKKGRTVSDVLVEQIVEWGVQYVLGVPGTSTLGIVDTIRKSSKVQYLQVRHEQTAAFMASAQSAYDTVMNERKLAGFESKAAVNTEHQNRQNADTASQPLGGSAAGGGGAGDPGNESIMTREQSNEIRRKLAAGETV